VVIPVVPRQYLLLSHQLYTLVATGINWRLNGPQRRSGLFGEDEKIFHLPGFEARFHGRPVIGYPDLQEKMCHLWSGVNEKKNNCGLF
jgi:hypothetical protein